MTSASRTKGGLGRGLDALLGDARPAPRSDAPDEPAGPLPASSRSLGQRAAPDEKNAIGARRQTMLPVESLAPNPNQPRRIFAQEAILELAASLRARGMLQPILVRPAGDGVFEIVAGEHRWRAAQVAQMHEVPVIIRELNDDQAAEIALIENVQRVDLNPIEEAHAYQRLSDIHRRTQEEIANAVGKSRSHVANIMRLLTLPQKCLDALNSGAITMGHAKALLGAPKPDLLVGFVIEKGLSVRQTEKLASAAAEARAEKSAKVAPATPASSAGGGPKDADTRALEADLAAALGLEVAIDHSKRGAGALTIRYLTLDQLDDLCRRLMGAGV